MSGLISQLHSFEREPRNGARRRIGDKECIYYDGYWIRFYDPPEETLAEKQQLIELLTRRLFHHTELGIKHSQRPAGHGPRRVRTGDGPETQAGMRRNARRRALQPRDRHLHLDRRARGEGHRDEPRQRADARMRGVLRRGAEARQDGQALQRPRGDRRALGRTAQGVLHVDGGLLREPLRQDCPDHARHRPHRRRAHRADRGGRAVARRQAAGARVRPGCEGRDGDDAYRRRDLRRLARVRRVRRAVARLPPARPGSER